MLPISIVALHSVWTFGRNFLVLILSGNAKYFFINNDKTLSLAVRAGAVAE